MGEINYKRPGTFRFSGVRARKKMHCIVSMVASPGDAFVCVVRINVNDERKTEWYPSVALYWVFRLGTEEQRQALLKERSKI